MVGPVGHESSGASSPRKGSRIQFIRILFFEGYVRTLMYSISAYVNKNRICYNYNIVV